MGEKVQKRKLQFTFPEVACKFSARYLRGANKTAKSVTFTTWAHRLKDLKGSSRSSPLALRVWAAGGHQWRRGFHELWEVCKARPGGQVQQLAAKQEQICVRPKGSDGRDLKAEAPKCLPARWIATRDPFKGKADELPNQRKKGGRTMN